MNRLNRNIRLRCNAASWTEGLSSLNPSSASRLALAGLCTALALAGCSTSKDKLLPHGAQSMLDIWNGTGNSQQRLLQARAQLRRPLREEAPQAEYSRTAANEIHSLFPRLPNPDLVLYIYPHLSGELQAPVPGYSTVLPLYRQVHYALPGERLDDL